MDPGAVPGRSTTFRQPICAQGGGPETGSTRVVKSKFASGMIPPLSGRFILANDNFVRVAANDNSVVAGDVAQAA